MVHDLAHGKRHRNDASTTPEQDYLTRFYANDWHALGVPFNFQPHQMALTDRKGREFHTRMNMKYAEDVYIVHSSAQMKPCDWLFVDEFVCMDRRSFANEKLYEHYLDVDVNDRKGPYERLPPHAVRQQLWSDTWASTSEVPSLGRAGRYDSEVAKPGWESGSVASL